MMNHAPHSPNEPDCVPDSSCRPLPSRPPPSQQGFVLIVALGFIIALTLVGVSMMDVSLLEQRMANNYTSTVKNQMQQEIVLRNSVAQLRQTHVYNSSSDVICLARWIPETASHNTNAYSNTYVYTDVIPANPCIIPSGTITYTANIINLDESIAAARYTNGVNSGTFWDDNDGTVSDQVIRFGDPDGTGSAGLYTDSNGVNSWNSPVQLVSSTFTDRANTELVIARYPGPPIYASIYSEGVISRNASNFAVSFTDSTNAGGDYCGSVFADKSGGTPDIANGKTIGAREGWFAVSELASPDLASANAGLTEDTRGLASSGGVQGDYVQNNAVSNLVPSINVAAVFNQLLASAPFTQIDPADLGSINYTSGTLSWRRYYIQGDGNPMTIQRISGLVLVDAQGADVIIGFNMSGLVVVINGNNSSDAVTVYNFKGALLADSNVEFTYLQVRLQTCSVLYALQNEPLYILQSHRLPQ